MLAALSLFFPYCCGLGFLAAAPISSDVLRASVDGKRSALLLALAALLGILVDYSLVLILGSLTVSLTAGVILAVTGLVYIGIKQPGSINAPGRISRFRFFLIVCLLVLFAVPVTLTPITEWDARSIWFFHAKMISYAGGMTGATGFEASAVQFSHVGYPKLVPVLAAQVAHVVGHWNEYLPKIGLLVLLVPAVLIAIAHFGEGMRLSNALLVTVLFLSQNSMLWNGLMDGYLALFTTLACLSLVRWLNEGDQADGFLTIACLAIAVSMKNEGLLIAAVITATAAGYLATSPANRQRAFLAQWRTWLLAGIGFSGTMLWFLKKVAWHLPQSADVAVPHTGRLVERLGSSDAVALIFQHVIIRSRVAVAVICLVFVYGVTRALRVRIDRTVWAPALIGALYCAGLVIIYINSPYELQWHVENSAGRTALPIKLSIFLSTVLLIRSWERKEPERFVRLSP